MRHITWNYKGYNDLDLDFDVPGLQPDWNLTLYNTICRAINRDNFNIFCSEPILDILKENAGFDQKSMTIFGKKIGVLLFTTPKIYVTKPEIKDFTMLEHDNHCSVTVQNYVTY